MSVDDALAVPEVTAGARPLQEDHQAALRTGHRRSADWILEVAGADPTSRPRPTTQLQGRRASLEIVLENATAGELVLLPLCAIPQVIQYCEVLLARGLSVAIDCTVAPPLRGPLSRRQPEGEWVILTPNGEDRAGPALYRVMDAIVGAFALLLLSPFLAIIAVAVRLTSPGPALFRTEMVGQRGRLFDLFKFRSMRAPSRSDEDEVRKALYRDFMAVASADDPKVVKVVNESRVTAPGRFLRKHSLDELPQFWNVMRGDLTLVGPRPCIPYEYELHEPWHRLRFRGKPGLTGLWQAYGRGKVTFEQMVLMDYCYSWLKSPGVDLRILAHTVFVVVTGEGGR